ncbi:DeoR family glycerol-3-phosphate regulon repressor [Nitrobacteraceae bacterium AZCC 1564]
MTDGRQAQILEMVREVGSASIEQLAAHFSVTQQTIRRIVNPLCEQGLLRRVHGGVGLPVSSQNLAYQSRQKLNHEAKQKIAKAVANFIPDGASVMIGLGTTPECVALALSGRSGLRVITNSLSTAVALAINPDIEITMAGGTLRPHDRDIIGDPAAQFFSGFKADFGVFGVGGIDEDGSLLDFYVGEVQARQAIAANCRTTMLVVDATKFGRNATVRGGHFGDCHHIFIDRSPPAKYQPLISQYTERTVIVNEDQFEAA